MLKAEWPAAILVDFKAEWLVDTLKADTLAATLVDMLKVEWLVDTLKVADMLVDTLVVMLKVEWPEVW